MLATIDQIHVAFTKYNRLMLLCKYLNGIYSKVFVPSIKYSVSTVGIICFYVALRVKVFPGMEYGFLVVAICVFVVVTSFANIISLAWFRSTIFLAKEKIVISNVKETQTKMYFRKVHKSLIPLRVSVGGLYYMEKEAKVTFIQFLVNGNINLLVTIK